MSRSIEGSIYRTKDGKDWFARLRYTDCDGARREKKRVCKTHGQAKNKLKELRDEIDREISDRKTYREIDRFFRSEYLHEAKYANGLKISGFRQNLKIIERYLDIALDHFGDSFIDEITYGDLESYKKKVANTPTIQNRQRSMADVNQNLRRVRRLLSVAVEQGWLAVNPFTRGKGLITVSHEVERTRIISADEEKLLIAACSGPRAHLLPMVIFALDTAARKGEIEAVTWFDVNFESRSIRVKNKSSVALSTRLVPMTNRVADSLRELRKYAHTSSGLVFNLGDFKRAWKGACKSAGLDDLHFHDLRHTAITRMLEKGISPPLVMKISGHTQQKTFLRYVNQNESSIYDIAIRLDQVA